MSRILNPFWFFLYGGWLTAVIVLSLDSDPPKIKLGLLSWDKFEHAAAYALMTFLGFMAFRGERSSRRVAAASAIVAVLLGAALEVGQGMLTSTRLAEGWDLLADALGAGAVLLAVFLFPSRQPEGR